MSIRKVSHTLSHLLKMASNIMKNYCSLWQSYKPKKMKHILTKPGRNLQTNFVAFPRVLFRDSCTFHTITALFSLRNHACCHNVCCVTKKMKIQRRNASCKELWKVLKHTFPKKYTTENILTSIQYVRDLFIINMTNRLLCVLFKFSKSIRNPEITNQNKNKWIFLTSGKHFDWNVSTSFTTMSWERVKPSSAWFFNTHFCIQSCSVYTLWSVGRHLKTIWPLLSQLT